MRRSYDFCVGIGGACSCSQALREAGMQYVSLPFDWVAYSDVRMRANQVRDDFVDWLPQESLEDFLFETSNTGAIKRNVRTGIVFPHDFHKDVPLATEWPRISEKYGRRIARMNRLIAASKRVLVVWVDVGLSPFADESDRAYVLEVFRRKWPGISFDLLHLSYEEGRAPANLLDQESENIRVVSFDYRDRGYSGWIADYKLIARWLRREYSVVDYRSPEEKANGRRRAKEKRYARFQATGFLDYLLTKFEYKLFVHLRKRLAGKGLA